jgi:5-methylcytosine-specific restriction endonuclease McrA
MSQVLKDAPYQYPFERTSETLKLDVWSKGREIPNYDPAVWRRDVCGMVMKYSQHGNTDSKYGWEIDHIYPRAKGGPTTLDNLQPLNWQTNRQKGDTYPYQCL